MNKIEELLNRAMIQQSEIADKTGNTTAFYPTMDLFSTLSDLKTELFKMGIVSEEYFLNTLGK